MRTQFQLQLRTMQRRKLGEAWNQVWKETWWHFIQCITPPSICSSGVHHSHWGPRLEKERLSCSFSLLKHNAAHRLFPSLSTLRLLLLTTVESRDGRTPASSGLLLTLKEHVAMVVSSPKADKTAVMYGFWTDTSLAVMNRTCAYHQQNIEIMDESLSSSDQLVLLYFTKRNIRKPGFNVW